MYSWCKHWGCKDKVLQSPPTLCCLLSFHCGARFDISCIYEIFILVMALAYKWCSRRITATLSGYIILCGPCEVWCLKVNCGYLIMRCVIFIHAAWGEDGTLKHICPFFFFCLQEKKNPLQLWTCVCIKAGCRCRRLLLQQFKQDDRHLNDCCKLFSQ